MDWYGNTTTCTPGCADKCDYNLHCFTYKIIVKTPECETHECEYQDAHGNWHPHKPAYVVFPHRKKCNLNMNFAQYFKRVFSVRADYQGSCGEEYCYLSISPDEFAIYDSSPDVLSSATGLKIPINDTWDIQGEYQFEVCMIGDSNTVDANKMDYGWSFNVEYGGLKTTWDYGYVCDNNIPLPDLCKTATTSYRGASGMLMAMNRPSGGSSYGNGNGNGMRRSGATNRSMAFSSPTDGPGPGNGLKFNVPNDDVAVQLVQHKWTLWNVFKAHESFIFVAILIVLGIGIFVSTFAQCLEY